MRKVLPILVVLALGGCAEVQKGVAFINAPSTQQAATTLRSGALAFVCAVSNATALAGQIEASINAGQSTKGTNGKLLTASSSVCTNLSGRVTGTAVAP